MLQKYYCKSVAVIIQLSIKHVGYRFVIDEQDRGTSLTEVDQDDRNRVTISGYSGELSKVQTRCNQIAKVFHEVR